MASGSRKAGAARNVAPRVTAQATSPTTFAQVAVADKDGGSGRSAAIAVTVTR